MIERRLQTRYLVSAGCYPFESKFSQKRPGGRVAPPLETHGDDLNVERPQYLRHAFHQPAAPADTGLRNDPVDVRCFPALIA